MVRLGRSPSILYEIVLASIRLAVLEEFTCNGDVRSFPPQVIVQEAVAFFSTGTFAHWQVLWLLRPTPLQNPGRQLDCGSGQ
jgi:hypothetical protein